MLRERDKQTDRQRQREREGEREGERERERERRETVTHRLVQWRVVSDVVLFMLQ